MLKKKRSVPQANPKPKKVPLITVPCLNIPEQPKMQLKGGKSIELRKTLPVNPYRKPVSRKSTCKSVKQNGSLRVPELSTIMQTFKELKLMHEQSRSKSRSPASCKSRSTKKYPLFTAAFKRKTSHTLGNNPASEVNLTLKLERTIKQLNQTDFFRDEDSLLPMLSASDLRGDDVTPHHLSSRNEEDFDLAQLRNFCSTVKLAKPSSVVQLSRSNYDSFKQNRAALKIQRAWKQFQTRRLVQRYAYLAKQQEEDEVGLSSSMREHIREPQGLSQIQQQEENHFGGSSPLPVPDAMMVQSQLLYGEEAERVRHISNLQQVGSNADYEEVVKRMKMEQLQKWNQIIQIISKNRSDSPQQLERLLQLLTQQSELNKRDLQARANQILAKTAHAKQKDEEVDRNNEIRREYSSSDHSAGLEQYDSKKYIEYLDGDIFPPDENSSEEQDRINRGRGVRISKRKQQLLLQELRSSNLPIKLGESSLYHSESVKCLEQPRSHRRQGSSRAGLRKSTSEKVLRSAIAQMSIEPPPPPQADEGEMGQAEQINLDLLTRQFLQGSDPHADNFDMVYSEEKLRAKLAQLSRLKEEFISQERTLREGDNQTQAFQRDEEDLQEVSQLKRSQPSLQLHQPMPRDQIRIEDGTPQKPLIKPIERDSPSDFDEDQNQKGEACAAAIFNTLIFQTLKDFTKSDRVADTFKAYSISLKPKRKQGKKKKGFPTSKAEIQLFLDGLLRYLNKEQPRIFRNLMVSTGPSALEMLRYMHQAGEEEGEVQESDSDEDESNVMVIPNRVFDAFWQMKEKSIVVQVPPHFDQPNAVIFKHQFQLLKSFNKIFYRSLFDTFNQCLDCQRNFGQYGRPFPWKRAPVFDHKKSDTTLQNHVEKARKRMLQVSITYCGLIIEREDMGSTINQDYVKTVHQDRLSRMLASDLIEAQERWIFYDDEETEILVEISNALYTELLIEVIEEVYENL